MKVWTHGDMEAWTHVGKDGYRYEGIYRHGEIKEGCIEQENDGKHNDCLCPEFLPVEVDFLDPVSAFQNLFKKPGEKKE